MQLGIKKTIMFVYIALTAYILLVLSCTTLKFLQIIPAIIIMWINYFCFKAGYKTGEKNISNNKRENIKISNGWILKQNNLTLGIVAIISIIFSIKAAYFYTGQLPINVISNIFSGVSNYYIYQSYYLETEIQKISLERYLHSLMLIYCAFVLFYSYIALMFFQEKLRLFQKFYLLIITISFLYFGLARGTSFEFFEIMILGIFITLYRMHNNSIKIILKKFLIIIIFIGIASYIFYVGIETRGISFTTQSISSDVFYDYDGIVPMISSTISFVIIVFFGYFAFGFQYISTYVTELWFTSVTHFFAGILPLGYLTLSGNDIQNFMYNLIDMGAKWHPDAILVINYFGYVGLLIICICLGYVSSKIEYYEKENIVGILTLFLIFLQMIAFPIGNFLLVSSTGKFLAVFLLIYWGHKLFKIKI